MKKKRDFKSKKWAVGYTMALSGIVEVEAGDKIEAKKLAEDLLESKGLYAMTLLEPDELTIDYKGFSSKS